MLSLFGFEIPGDVVTLGIISGITYGLLAVGLVLIYRSNRIINFAHGEIGAFGAAFLVVAVAKWSVPYWIAFVVAVIAAGGIGAISDVVVIRRLRNAPALMSIVATIGLGQVLLLISRAMSAQITVIGGTYPQPSLLPRFGVGALIVTQAHFAMLSLGPPVVLVLALFFRRSRYGLAIRGAAANPDAARLAGVSGSRMSSLSWAIAGALSGFTAILVAPSQGLMIGSALGTGLLVRALAAAVLARLSSLPVALVAGLGIGVVEQLLLWNYRRGGVVELVLFLLIVGVLLTQRRHGAREEEKGSWAAIQPWRPIPQALLRARSVRNLGWIVSAIALIASLVFWALAPPSAAITLVVVFALGLLGLSLGIVTGLSGQLSLGQFALAGVGAAVSVRVVASTGNFPLAFVAAGAVTGAASLAIGLPALRLRGLLLAISTLGLAVASEAWFFQQSWMFGEGVEPGRPIFGSIVLDTSKSYYLFALVILMVTLFVTRNIWRTGVARRFIAIRDNEDAARAFTVSATSTKLQAFVIAGVIAGVGGALFAHALSRVAPATFPSQGSIDVVAMTVLGGAGILAGPLIGALYVIGIPRFIPLDSAGLAASSAGWLLLILYFPGGIAQLIRPVRDRIISWFAALEGITKIEIEVEPKSQRSVLEATIRAAPAAQKRRATHGDVVLSATDLRKHFGGVRAVDGVSLELRKGETLGLIGPNGAGKTTLFELLGGFTEPNEGTITLDGQVVTSFTPERRARLGLIRSFQDASLFPTMNVRDVIKLALEKSAPTRVGPSLLGLRSAERRKDQGADQLIEMMGLDVHEEKQINELSTGTRRIVELTCCIALEPTVLLLDEPSSGISQRETEALGDLLDRVKSLLDATLIVIEHDIPLITRAANRLIAMESGRVIAEGKPREVIRNPLVIESYLGEGTAAIQRSNSRSAKPKRTQRASRR